MNMAGIWPGHGREIIGTCPEHGKNMAGAWSGYDRDMTGTWLEHGWNMTRTWPKHGQNMAEIRPWYGRDMAGTWQEHDWGMIGIWHGYDRYITGNGGACLKLDIYITSHISAVFQKCSSLVMSWWSQREQNIYYSQLTKVIILFLSRYRVLTVTALLLVIKLP